MNENKLLIKHSDTFFSRLDSIATASLMLMLLAVPLAFYKNEFIWIKVFVIYLLFWPILIVYFLKSMVYQSVDFFYTPVMIPVLLLDIIACLSSFHAYNSYLSLQVLVKQIAYQMPFFLFIYYAKDIKMRTMIIIVSAIAVIVSIYGIAQFLHVIAPPLDPWGRPNPASTMGLTNFTTDYLVMVIPFMLSAFFSEHGKGYVKYGAYAGIILSLAYILIGKNRAGWIAAVSSLLLYALAFVFFKIHKHVDGAAKRLLLYTGIAAIIVMGFGLGFTKTGAVLVQRGESIFSKDYPSNAFRLLVWKSTFKGIKDNPVFGVGIGNYQINIPLYEVGALKTTDWKELRYLNDAHNEYIQILFELGIAGLLLFLWFLGERFVVGIRSLKDSRDDTDDMLWNTALLSGIVGALITAFFTFNLENPASAMLFWVFAGLIVGKRKYRHFEDEYGFVSVLKKLSGFKWRWKYDFEIALNNNLPLTIVFVIVFLITVILLGDLTSFSQKQTAAHIYTMEAETFLDLKMPKKAVKIIAKANALSQNDYMILYTLARAEAGSLDTADAIVDAKKVISLAPYFFYGHKLLGFLYYNKDNYAGAINEFNTSVDLMPLSITEVGPYLVSSYLSTNEVDNAISLATNLLKDDPQHEVYTFLLGTAFYMKGDYPDALKYLKEAVKKDPTDFNATLNLTECLEKTNDYKDALVYAVQLTKIAPDNPVAWYTLARSSMLLHDEAGAFDALARLFKINPSYKMTVVNDSVFSKLLGKPRMKELLTGKVFVFQPAKRKSK